MAAVAAMAAIAAIVVTAAEQPTEQTAAAFAAGRLVRADIVHTGILRQRIVGSSAAGSRRRLRLGTRAEQGLCGFGHQHAASNAHRNLSGTGEKSATLRRAAERR